MQDFPEDEHVQGSTVELVEGDPANRELLQKAGVAFCDSVIIGGILDGRPAKEADALTITLVMLVQECLAAAGRDETNPAHIVGMVSSDSIRNLSCKESSETTHADFLKRTIPPCSFRITAYFLGCEIKVGGKSD